MNREKRVEELKNHLEAMVGNSSKFKAEKLVDLGYKKQKVGKWSHLVSTTGSVYDIYICSACDHITGWRTNYCPNCGCKMKREENKNPQ